jgi:hypothetical protein
MRKKLDRDEPKKGEAIQALKTPPFQEWPRVALPAL